jgi:hypothetical protein
MSKSKKSTLFLTLAASTALTGLLAGSTRAATVLTDIGGSGWSATFSDLSLVSDPNQPSGQLDVEKAATFTEASAGEGLLITFTQTSANAKPVIDFTDESITNVTGETWTGFDFILLNANGNASFETTANSPFAPPAGIFSDVSTTTIDGNPAVVYSGGSQANLATSLWGIGADGDLLIDADPLGIGTTFTFKEVPADGSAPVPLPAAVWQGFVGLAGLGLVAASKKLRRPAAE